jgi:hypothetical protein
MLLAYTIRELDNDDFRKIDTIADEWHYLLSNLFPIKIAGLLTPLKDTSESTYDAYADEVISHFDV